MGYREPVIVDEEPIVIQRRLPRNDYVEPEPEPLPAPKPEPEPELAFDLQVMDDDAWKDAVEAVQQANSFVATAVTFPMNNWTTPANWTTSYSFTLSDVINAGKGNWPNGGLPGTTISSTAYNPPISLAQCSHPNKVAPTYQGYVIANPGMWQCVDCKTYGQSDVQAACKHPVSRRRNHGNALIPMKDYCLDCSTYVESGKGDSWSALRIARIKKLVETASQIEAAAGPNPSPTVVKQIKAILSEVDKLEDELAAHEAA